MGRWQPDAVGRLGRAAIELFEDHGYDEVTVADIADRAGVTSRTFFRYFSDKREVLFYGSAAFQDYVLEAFERQPAEGAPLESVAAALASTGDLLTDRAWSRRRQQLILEHRDLQERELTKLSTLAGALADALVARGVDRGEATLAGQAGIAVYRTAFQRWTEAPGPASLGAIVHCCFGELRDLIATKTR